MISPSTMPVSTDNASTATPASSPTPFTVNIRRVDITEAETLSAICATTFVETFGHLYKPDDLSAYLTEAYSLERTRADLSNPAKAAWFVEVEVEHIAEVGHIAGSSAHDVASGKEKKIVGYAQAGPCELPHSEVTPSCVELKRFYLLKGWQNAGLGSKLFEVVFAWLQSHGSDMWIGVWSENYGAQRFYGRYGFTKVGEYGFPVGDHVDKEFILRRKRA